jgi:O-antigen/teichoic acid export membrane protein
MSVTEQQKALLLHHRVAKFFFGKLARASGWIIAGGIAAGFLGYVFQILMGRMLSTQEYGLFGAMMALFAVLTAPYATLMMIVSRKVSEYRIKQDSGSITHLYYSINIRAAVVGVFILGVYYFLVPQIQFYLKAPSVTPVYLLGLLLFLFCAIFINNAFLQGMQRFIWLSMSGFLNILFKIIFSTVFVWLGYGVAGAIGGTILAIIMGWFIVYGVLHRSLEEGRSLPFQTRHLSMKSAPPVLAANVAFGVMTQFDIVLVNYYFPAHEAGLYAAASILGKAVMYLPTGVAMALFPMVAENHVRSQSSIHLLMQSVGLTIFLSGACAAFYFMFGEEIIGLLYGEDYRGAGEVLRFYGFAILPMALVLVAEHFLIAKERVLFAYLFLLTAPLQLIGVYFFHDSLQMVVAVMGVCGLILVLLGYGLLGYEFLRSKSKKY